MVKKGELLSVFSSSGAAGYSLLEILWEGQYPLDDDAGRRHLFYGKIHLANIYAKALSVWEKMFSGIRADYNC